MSKHVRGPLEIDDDIRENGQFIEELVRDAEEELYCYEINNVSACIVRLFVGKNPTEIDKANTHLFAAAPDMYEALKVCRDFLSTVCGSMDDDFLRMLNEVEQALTKAEGMHD